MSSRWALPLFLFFFVTVSQAQIVNVNIHGSGCLDGTASYVLSPDAKTLSVLFDQYQMRVSDGSQDNKICIVDLSVKVPKNKRILIERVDYRMYAELPYYSKLLTETEVTHVKLGTHTPLFGSQTLNRDYMGKYSGEVDVIHRFNWGNGMPMPKCGQSYDLSLRSDLSLYDKGMQPGEEAVVVMDSLDAILQSRVQYVLRESNCIQ